MAWGYGVSWLVLTLVRQQLHALLDLLDLVDLVDRLPSLAGGGQELAAKGCRTTTVHFINRHQSLP